MPTPATLPARYDPRTIRLHWLTALLVAGLWTVGQTIDWFPKGAARVNARSLHITFGALLGLVIVARLWWRLNGATHLPAPDSGAVRMLSTLTHRLLYLLLFVTVALGVTNAWARGDSLYGLFSLTSFTDDKGVREQIEDLHGLAANCLAGLAAFHAAAGLLHHFVFKDNVLARMIPFVRER